MLVTQRRQGESIIIGGNIEVTVIDISGHSVRLGIQAPREISIQRAEVVLTKQQNLAAAKTSGSAAVSSVLKHLAPPRAEEPKNEEPPQPE